MDPTAFLRSSFLSTAGMKDYPDDELHESIHKYALQISDNSLINYSNILPEYTACFIQVVNMVCTAICAGLDILQEHDQKKHDHHLLNNNSPPKTTN